MRPSRYAWLLAAALWAPASPALASTRAAYRHYLKALLLQHRGEYEQSLQEYETAARLDPQSAYILEQAAELALESGQSARALEFAKRLVALDPNSPKFRHLLGNVHWSRGQVREAQQAFEEALKLKPDFGEVLFALGNLLSAESPDKARRYFQDYLTANPDHAAEAHYQIALVDQRAGDVEEAVGHLKSAIALEPSFLQARYSLAHIYEARRDTEAALGEYQTILEVEPGNVALLNHIGEIYMLKGDLESAEALYLRAKALAPSNPGACLWLAILAEQRGDYARAAEELSQSAALKDEAELRLRLSYYYTQANRHKDAMAVLEEAQRRWPDNNEIAYFLALGYEDLKSYDKAIGLLKRVLERSHDHRDARFQLAALYEKTDRMEESEREFRVLLEARPNDASALNYLGYSLTDRGLKLEEAEGLIRRALAQDPDNGAYRDSLGWSHYKQGRFPQALEELQAALRLMPEDATLWDHLGDIRQGLGKTVEAWDAWKWSLAYDSSNAKVVRKTAAAEAGWGEEELGGRLLDFLRRIHGGVESLGALCDVAGEAGGRNFSYRGILTYKKAGPEKARGTLSLELLGPLFIPVFRIELTEDGSFSMDPLRVDGADPEALREALRRTIELMRDALGGGTLEESPARYHRGWRAHSLVTPTRQLLLTDDRVRLKGFQPAEGGWGVSLDGFVWKQGRSLPTQIEVRGKGFSVGLKLRDPAVRFASATP